MESITELNEHKARSLRGRLRESSEGPIFTLETQIALTQEHIDQARAGHEEVLRMIILAETYVGSDLMHLDSGYIPMTLWTHRLRARDQLTARLSRLAEERRHLKGEHRRELAQLQQRLSELLAQHSYLIPHDD